MQVCIFFYLLAGFTNYLTYHCITKLSTNTIQIFKCKVFLRQCLNFVLHMSHPRIRKEFGIPRFFHETFRSGMQSQYTDKRTDVWSRNLMIWKINFGLWAVALAGLCNKRVWARFFTFSGSKEFFLIFLKTPQRPH